MAPISKVTAVMLAVVFASALIMTPAAAHPVNKYGLNDLKNALDGFAKTTDVNAQVTGLKTTLADLQTQINNLKNLVASFYNPNTKTITASDYIVLANLVNKPNWVIHLENDVFVVRQLDATKDYRYAFYPNKYTDV